jgi:hypothetical protein
LEHINHHWVSCVAFALVTGAEKIAVIVFVTSGEYLEVEENNVYAHLHRLP